MLPFLCCCSLLFVSSSFFDGLSLVGVCSLKGAVISGSISDAVVLGPVLDDVTVSNAVANYERTGSVYDNRVVTTEVNSVG